MASSIYLRVTYTDEREETVRVGPKAQVLYERNFGEGFFEYSTKPSTEKLYFMAWQSLEVAGKKPPPFEDFLDTLEEVTVKRDTPDDPVDDDAVNPEVDPTQKAQRTDT